MNLKNIYYSRYFSKFLFDLGKIDLPRITHAKFHIEIGTKCHLRIDYEMIAYFFFF